MREHVALRRGGWARLTILMALAVAGVVAPAAEAGQLTLNLSTDGPACTLFTPFSASPWVHPVSCGTGPLSAAFQARTLTDVTGIIGGPLIRRTSLSLPAGTRIGFQINAPVGIMINHAIPGFGSVTGTNTGAGWGGVTYWAGGHDKVPSDAPLRAIADAAGEDGPFNSTYWGFLIACGWATCSNSAHMSLNTVTLTATENQAPILTPGSDLWGQTGRWIWNPPGDLWALSASASDVSGVCGMSAEIGDVVVPGPSAVPNTSQWQQCPDPTWTTGVDTRDYASGSGSLPIALNARNAAGVQGQASETFNVDDTPVSLSLSTPNDANPTVWVNHGVEVDAAATAGASGVAGTTCRVGDAAAQAYPSGGVWVNGDGVRTVACTTWNGAVDPQGSPASATSTMTVHIDEAAPSLSWQSASPSDPTGLAVTATDNEAGVAGGSIEMSPAGSNDWSSLPTTFDGSRLLAHFDDGNLHGTYRFKATGCDRVGNCDSTTQELSLPVRLASTSEVGFQAVRGPDCGSSALPIRAPVARAGRGTAGSAARPRRHVLSARRWPRGPVCTAPTGTREREQVAHGQPVIVHGRLLSSTGVPLAGQTVNVLTAPQNGSGALTPVRAVSTDAGGAWTATLPAGPSRIIEAAFAGTATILPSTGQAKVTVPARIAISVWPRRLPWSGVVTIRGHLVGGYVPPDGVALRLLVRYPGSRVRVPILALRTTPTGAFRIPWTYRAGHGVASYPFWISTTATESDYPFAAANSRKIMITFGVRTPAAAHRARRANAARHHRHRRSRASGPRHRRRHARGSRAHRARHARVRAQSASHASTRRGRHRVHATRRHHRRGGRRR